MKVIAPVVITAAQLVSSSVPEDEYLAYAAGTGYAVGARVIYANKIYESVQTPNVGHQPDTSPLYWAAISATNRFMMFDTEVSTQTVATGPLTVKLAPGVVANSLSVLELDGSSISVSITDGPTGAVIYTYQRDLDATSLADWYEYFTLPFKSTRQITLTNLPSTGAANVTIQILGSTVKCGYVILGNVSDLGLTQYNPTIGIIDYSRKETSATGVSTFVKRKFSRRMSARFELATPELNRVQRTLADLRATPCVWVGTEAPGFETLTVFGFYKDFTIDVAYATSSFCSLEIEGLT